MRRRLRQNRAGAIDVGVGRGPIRESNGMPELTVARDERSLADLDEVRRTEWMVTNARGGFAMASVAQVLTRRYHGLLISAPRPPSERWLLLAKLEARVITGTDAFELSTNDYPSAVHPTGYRFVESFVPSPIPTWRYRLPDGARIEQSIFMAPDADTTFVQWRLLSGPSDLLFEVRPLCTSRDMHVLAERYDLGEPRIDEYTGGFRLSWSGGRPGMSLSTNGAFEVLPDWYYRFVLSAETARGLDDRQDLYMPGPIRATLRRGDGVGLIVAASAGPVSWSEWSRHRAAAVERRSTVPLPEEVEDPLARALARASGEFIVRRGHQQQSVIAGYPWFTDWGRDTFISLPGLCLVTGRWGVARQVIWTFAHYTRDGLIPNRFPDVGEDPEYNTVDASLWFIHAIDRYLAYSGDWSFVGQDLFGVIAGILDAHERGTRYHIGVDRDGLLAAGEPGVQLTWMDAKVDDWVVTPRIGKPVEISALWYNALLIAADFADRLEQRDRAAHWRGLASRARETFNRRFWNEALGCCHDVIDEDHVAGRIDAAIRPNQLFSISLTHPILERSRWPAVVRIVQDKLWTPVGLRTLDPAHPDYKSCYRGDRRRRDAAYHQGTVWPWLLGPFVTAYVRAHGDSDDARREARELLAGLEQQFFEAGLESVSEVADGDPPHVPGGCPWQAWSVAEPLRALVEDVLGQGPPAARRRDGATVANAAAAVPR